MTDIFFLKIHWEITWVNSLRWRRFFLLLYFYLNNQTSFPSYSSIINHLHLKTTMRSINILHLTLTQTPTLRPRLRHPNILNPIRRLCLIPRQLTTLTKNNLWFIIYWQIFVNFQIAAIDIYLIIFIPMIFILIVVFNLIVLWWNRIRRNEVLLILRKIDWVDRINVIAAIRGSLIVIVSKKIKDWSDKIFD